MKGHRRRRSRVSGKWSLRPEKRSLGIPMGMAGRSKSARYTAMSEWTAYSLTKLGSERPPAGNCGLLGRSKDGETLCDSGCGKGSKDRERFHGAMNEDVCVLIVGRRMGPSTIFIQKQSSGWSSMLQTHAPRRARQPSSADMEVTCGGTAVGLAYLSAA